MPVGNVDVAIAPLLWRAQLIDRKFGSRILEGLPVLARRFSTLMLQAPFADVLSDQMAGIFTSKYQNMKGILTSGYYRADWMSTFGAATPTSLSTATVREL